MAEANRLTPRDLLIRGEALGWLVAGVFLILTGPCIITSRVDANPRDAEASLVLRRASGVSEPSEAALDRMFGRFSREDSSRWIRSLTPGRGVLWITEETRRIRVHLKTEMVGDSVRSYIGHERKVLLELPNQKSDAAQACTVTWDLRDSKRKRIGPGLYSLHVRAGGEYRELMIVQSPTRAEDGWRLRY